MDEGIWPSKAHVLLSGTPAMVENGPSEKAHERSMIANTLAIYRVEKPRISENWRKIRKQKQENPIFLNLSPMFFVLLNSGFFHS